VKRAFCFSYGVMEKQFHNYYVEASRRAGKTGDNLLQLLECRLDNVVYRAGFARTRRHARQLVNHGHFLVNGKKVDIPSFQVTAHDVIDVREKSLEMARGDPVADARPRPPGPGPGADRPPGPGAAHRRVLLEEVTPGLLSRLTVGQEPTILPSPAHSDLSNSG